MTLIIEIALGIVLGVVLLAVGTALLAVLVDKLHQVQRRDWGFIALGVIGAIMMLAFALGWIK